MAENNEEQEEKRGGERKQVSSEIAEKEKEGFSDRLKKSFRSFFSRLNPVPSRPGPEIKARDRFGTESLSVKVPGELVEKYGIGQAQVFIYRKEGGRASYGISEPSLSEDEQEIYQDLLENFFYSLGHEAAEEPGKYLEGSIWDAAYDLGLLDEVRDNFAKYKYFLERDAFGFGKIHVPMEDGKVEEITINEPGDPAKVIHRDHTELGWLETNIRFRSEEALRNYNERIAQRLGETLTAAEPIIDATTQRGDRLSMTFGDEVTQDGSVLTVRKRPEEPMTLAFLVSNGTLSSLMAAYLWQVLEWRGFLEVIGPVGSGKTTLMNAVLGSMDPATKRITIEETLELNLPDGNWQSFKTREVGPTMGDEYEYDLFDLVKTSMRHRPDFLAVGEVRGEEMEGLVHAASLGHSACSTLHADSPEHALTRLRTAPIDLDAGEILLIWAFALTRPVRLPSGEMARRVASLYELVPDEENEPTLHPIFEYDPQSDTFSPDSVEEVLDRSERFQSALETRAETRKGTIEALKEKQEFLEGLVEKGETGFDVYEERLREFYREE